MHIIKKPLFALLLLLSPLAQGQGTLKPLKASVSFTIRNAGLSVEGSFRGFLGELIFDPKAPEKGSLSASVEANTIETGINLRNNHLRKTDYFDVATYPRISLKSVKLARQTGNQYEGTFNLTLKGVTRTVAIPFMFTEEKDKIRFDGQFTINRLDYKVGNKSLLMSNDVIIRIQVQATGYTDDGLK